MMRSLPIVAVTGAWFVLLSLSVPSQSPAGVSDARRLADVPIDYSAMSTEARGVYDIAMHVGEIGIRGELSFTAKVTMSTTVARDHVLMEDEWEIMGREIGLRMTCDRAPLLRLRESAFVVSRKDQSMTASLKVAGETCVINANEQTQEIPYPADTLMQAAAFRLVPLLPREAGVSYPFDHYTESVEVKVRNPSEGETFDITCFGPETITVRGQNIRCTKYVLNVPRPIEFFVDDRGTIRMALADGGETVIVRRETGVAGETGPNVR